MHIEMVGGPVGKIDQREWVFILNGRYRPYSVDINC
jgi:hypothetical protein